MRKYNCNKSFVYWTYEKCLEEALKYNNRKELRENNNWVYTKILKKKWLELFDHMYVLGSCNKRLVYVYEFSDNSCYVGLTGDIKRRNRDHLNSSGYKSPVLKHIEKTNLIPKLIIKTDYIDCQKACELECEYINIYKENGWILLNTNKGGVIGGNGGFSIWDYDKCKEAALKCESRYEFQKNYSGAYHKSRKNGWLDDFCKHMKSVYWDYDKCKEAALSYDGRWDFLQKEAGAYYWAKNNNVLDEMCSHMKTKRVKWNYELCKLESTKYKTRSEYHKNSQSSYNFSRKNGWLDDFFPPK